MNQTISYQGEPGANSHIIINEAYPDWTPLPRRAARTARARSRSWGVSTPSGTSSTTTASIRIPASSARSPRRPGRTAPELISEELAR
jgi:acyl transferase domain-containing protein